MKLVGFCIALLGLMVALPSYGKSLTVIGDSLTKEYQITFPGIKFPPLVDIEGIDPLNPSARNWAEILHERRNAHFDSGSFRSSLLFPWTDLRVLGHQYNWAVAGATARAISLMVTNPDSPELLADPDFVTLISFAPDWKLGPQRITAQLRSGSAASVVWCGGNDLRFGNSDPATSLGGGKISYATIYAGDGTGLGDPQPLMDSIRKSIQTVALFMKNANPALPVVVCAVPHVGASPEVKALWPTDAVRTGRITTALDSLNAELKHWTENTLNGVWVDLYSNMKQLITDTLEIGGVSFINNSDAVMAVTPAAAHNRYLFSHDGFHPGTPVQARVAQLVQSALKTKAPAAFADTPLIGDREVIVTILGLPVSEGYDQYMTSNGVPPARRGPEDDPDQDGLKNILEFALAGQDPMKPDSGSAGIAGSNGNTATLTWMPRFARNIYASITCQQSPNLGTWTDVPAAQQVPNPDGSVTASIDASGIGPVFLRLKVAVTP